MKKAIFTFIVAALVLITIGLWYFSSNESLRSVDLLMFSIIILIAGFAVFLGYRRLSSARKGEPAEDELSKKIMQKTAGLSFYISLYLWLALMYFSDRIKLETHSVIGIGILGMAVTFAICWLVINLIGFKNE